ncbi:MAG: MCP four helix bundle domain-containing protein, partial [Fibromonadaceae bacterium]|nr:MCP four helix bundle domain-containing protein [Fibromonadaceae bacterium]
MKNVRIGVKLIASYVLITVIAVAVGIYQNYELHEMDKLDTQLYNIVAKALGEAVPVVAQIGDMQANMYKILLAPTAVERARFAQVIDSEARFVAAALETQKQWTLKDDVVSILDNSIKAVSVYN